MYIRGWARKALLLEMCVSLIVITTEGACELVGSLAADSVDSGLSLLRAVGSRRQKNEASRRCKMIRWERDPQSSSCEVSLLEAGTPGKCSGSWSGSI